MPYLKYGSGLSLLIRVLETSSLSPAAANPGDGSPQASQLWGYWSTLSQVQSIGLLHLHLHADSSQPYLLLQLATLLYRKHVLEDEDVPGVPAQLPPYFSQDFFNIIKKVKTESPLSITSLTEKDWSRLLTEDCVKGILPM